MLGNRLALLGAVVKDPALRRAQGGFLLSTIAEWASWLALVVYAYDRGGAAEAGVVGFVLGAPVILVVPAVSIIGDRWPRARVLLAVYLLLALAFLATGLLLAAGAAVAGYLAGVVAMLVLGLVRPLLGALLPEVAGSPDALTAANVVSGLVEGVGALVGPLAAGALLAAGGAPLVLGACAIVLAVAAVAMGPIAAAPSAVVSDPVVDGEPTGRTSLGDFARELAAGATAVLADRRLTAAVVLVTTAIGLLGALGVFIVVIAIDVLGLDEGAVGYLTAVSGIGALIGSAASIVLVGRERLGIALVGGTAAFGLSVAALGLVRDPLGVALVLMLTGIGWTYAYVAATTLTQRLAGDDVMTRVFGLSEATQTFAEALGALAVPILVVAFGTSGAMIAAGLALSIVALAAAPLYLRAERTDPELLRDVRLLRAVPMFEPLSAPVIERLAHGAIHVSVPAGAAIVNEGEPGDRLYLLAEGSADVIVGGREVRVLGPGEVFGEIALLRDVPRTATVRARTAVELLAVDRAPFLEALTGQARSRRLAGEVAAGRLAADAAAKGP